MPNPTCPHCGTAIEEHEATRCLDWWVFEAVICDKPLSDENREVLPYANVHRYSDSIAAAFEVVDKLKHVLVQRKELFTPPYIWRVQLFEKYGCEATATGAAPTAPLAICRAAILATQEEKT